MDRGDVYATFQMCNKINIKNNNLSKYKLLLVFGPGRANRTPIGRFKAFCIATMLYPNTYSISTDLQKVKINLIS